MVKIYYFVHCFERYLIIEVEESKKEQAEHIIDSAYDDWCNSDTCECCEEYILSCLADAGIAFREIEDESEKTLANLFDEWADFTDATRYFSTEELQESKETFISDIMNGHTQHYIDMMRQEIAERRPVGKHGVYDFSDERQIETMIETIERIAGH